jgi:hypothetical protein
VQEQLEKLEALVGQAEGQLKAAAQGGGGMGAVQGMRQDMEGVRSGMGGEQGTSMRESDVPMGGFPSSEGDGGICESFFRFSLLADAFSSQRFR